MRPRYPLAVVAPTIGARSETFVWRHMTGLGPTASVGRVKGADWRPHGPVLDLDSGLSGGRGIHSRVARAVLRKTGRRPEQWAVKRFLSKHGTEVLMGEYLNFSLPWLTVAQELGVRFFAHGHGYDVSELLRDANWRGQYQAYVDADGVIVVSESSRRRLLDLGLRRVSVIPCSTDVPGAPLAHPEGDTIRCLAVGRMVAKKAPIVLLDSFRRASERISRLHLDYVGDGPLFASAERYVEAHGLADRVRLHGALAHASVALLMRRADIFVQHSITDPDTGDAEGLPVSILEAMAAALPVVATRHEGIVDAIPDDSVGLLVDEFDAQGMADRIELLANSSDQRRGLGDAGWARAAEHFSWEREQERLRALLGI